MNVRTEIYPFMDVVMIEASQSTESPSVLPSQSRLRICFVAPMMYPVLDPGIQVNKIGGAEVQQLLLGKAFSENGYSVHYVTRDHGQPDPCVIDDFVIHKSYRTSSGIPGFRFFYPRVPSLWRALDRANADIYYVRGAGYLVELVAQYARYKGRLGVFAVASDTNVDPDLQDLPTARDRWLYERGLRNIDAIVVQSNHQANLLKQHYGRTACLIRNSWPQPDTVTSGQEPRNTVLWVAMHRDIKQPEHFVRLAKAMPELNFVMIGGPRGGSEELYQSILRQSAGVNNLEVVGFKSLEETQEYYRRALALVNTSTIEGFPNTFLQAWAEGIPVVSYLDPDNLIKNNDLGRVAKDEQDLPSALQEALDLYPGCSDRIKTYYRDNHSPDGAVRQYERLFNSLLDNTCLSSHPRGAA